MIGAESIKAPFGWKAGEMGLIFNFRAQISVWAKYQARARGIEEKKSWVIYKNRKKIENIVKSLTMVIWE